MRITKILSTILALVMVIGSFGAISVSADDSEPVAAPYTVYVDGTKTADGDGTQTTPYKTVAAAIENINAHSPALTAATIVIAGNTTLPTNSNYAVDAHTATITYTAINSAVLTFGGTRRFNGPTVLKDISIAGGKNIFAMGHKFVVDTGVTTSGNFTISGGTPGVSTWEETPTSEIAYGVDITIKSGKWADVYAVGLYGGKIEGDINIDIDGADTVVTDLWLSTQNSAYRIEVTGKTTVSINNGSFTRFIIGSTGADTGTNNVEYMGDVHIAIRGGTISSRFGIHDSCADQVTFKSVILDYSGAAEETKTVWQNKLKTKNSYADYTSCYKVTDCAAVGMQVSDKYTVGEGDEAYDANNVRFIIGVRNYEEITSASVTVVARDAAGEAIRTFTDVVIKEVYTSVIASVDGVNKSVTAKEMGANYIMALTVTGIPTEAGVAYFEVTPTIDTVAAPTSTFTYSVSK